jgi:hypothetical protein
VQEPAGDDVSQQLRLAHRQDAWPSSGTGDR